jgi:hypothetical protein
MSMQPKEEQLRLPGMRIMLGLLAFVFVLAGCGKQVSAGAPADQPSLEVSTEVRLAEPAQPAPAGPVDSVPTPLPTDCPGPLPDGLLSVEQTALPAGFVTTWVFRCRMETRPKPGEGEWTYQILERADTDAKSLVEQLLRPSDPQTNQPCTLELRTPPHFALVDAAGKGYRPAVPTDGCGKPRIEVFKLLEAMRFRVLSEKPVQQVVTQKSIDTGCPDSYKDLVTYDNIVSHDAPVGPVWAMAVTDLRICVYASPGNEPNRAGKLTSSRVVSGNNAKSIVDQFNAARPAVTCDQPHTAFATVAPVTLNNPVSVELDGCQRMLRPDSTLVQLNEGAITALKGS